jgi:hypothetical protein
MTCCCTERRLGGLPLVFRQPRGEGRLRDAAKSVIDERRGVLGGIGDAGEIIFQIVGARGDVQRRVGNADETIGAVIRIALMHIRNGRVNDIF